VRNVTGVQTCALPISRDQLAKLADKLKGHRRTPRETPTVNPVFIVEMHLMMTDGAPQASSVSDDFLADLLVAIQTADGHLRHQEIGRASCRARAESTV